MNQVRNLPKYKKIRKYLRNNATRAEKLLWQELKNIKIGYKFRRQQSINQYIVDFYCPEVKLIVELDGEVHNYENTSKKDYLRDLKLEALNYKIIRIKNYNILNNLIEVVENIKNICDHLDKKHVK